MGYCAGQIKYLTAIKELKDKGGRIRCVNISNLLGVSRPSVSKMLRQIGMRADWTVSGKESIVRAIEEFFRIYRKKDETVEDR